MLNSYFYIQSGLGTLFRVHTNGKDFFAYCVASDDGLLGLRLHIRRYARGQYKWLLDGKFEPLPIKVFFPTWDLRRIHNLLIDREVDNG